MKNNDTKNKHTVYRHKRHKYTVHELANKLRDPNCNLTELSNVEVVDGTVILTEGKGL